MNFYKLLLPLSFAFLAFPFEGQSSPAVETLSNNLKPAIERAAQNPRQFAVAVDKSINASTDGVWAVNGDRATWTYAVKIPEAVSVSFRAVDMSLPAGAVLADNAHTYRFADVPANQEVWGRVNRGDTLNLQLTVPIIQRAQLRLHIVELQAGFRGLAPTVSDSETYQELKTSGQAASTSDCSENYSCDSTSANSGPSHATVGIIIKNTIECTGTLLNDVAGDLIPYLLTAQHCGSSSDSLQNAANPADAATMTFYFDAVTACGQMLGSVYDGQPQQGATSEALAGDAWLLRLIAPPVVADSYYAGWDASGTGFSGGYAVHYGNNTSQQYVSYSGAAIVTQFSLTRYSADGSTAMGSFTENQWGVNTQLGWNPPGSSGGGLFDPNNRLIGDHTGYRGSGRSCPTSPPVAPTQSTVQYVFQQLSDVYSGKASDPTATSATIQSFLDPGNSGVLIVDGKAGVAPPAPAETLSISAPSIIVGQSVTLTWNSSDASSCSASGNWSGAVATSGTYTYTPPSSGQYSYDLACANAGGSVTKTVTLSVTDNTPTESLTISPSSITLGQSATLSWQSTNATSCTASGSWSGTQSTNGSSVQTPAAAGSYSYQLLCNGSGGTATQSVALTVSPSPSSPAPSPTPGTGSGGGGGPFDPTLLMALGALALMRRRK